MNTAEDRLQKRRNRILAENSQKDYDYGKPIFFFGLIMMLVLSILLFFAFGFFTLEVLRKLFGPAEDMAQIAYVFFAVVVGVFGYFFGQLVALIIIRRIAKKYQGNIFFGTHPVRNMVLACFFFYNILFYLLLGVFAVFKGF